MSPAEQQGCERDPRALRPISKPATTRSAGSGTPDGHNAFSALRAQPKPRVTLHQMSTTNHLPCSRGNSEGQEAQHWANCGRWLYSKTQMRDRRAPAAGACACTLIPCKSTRVPCIQTCESSVAFYAAKRPPSRRARLSADTHVQTYCRPAPGARQGQRIPRGGDNIIEIQLHVRGALQRRLRATSLCIWGKDRSRDFETRSFARPADVYQSYNSAARGALFAHGHTAAAGSTVADGSAVKPYDLTPCLRP